MRYNGRGLDQAEVDALLPNSGMPAVQLIESLDAQKYLQMRDAGGLTFNKDTIFSSGPSDENRSI